MEDSKKIIDFVNKNRNDRGYEYHSCTYLHLSMHYWVTTIFNILGYTDEAVAIETIEFLKSCKNSDGGYGSTKGYPSTVFNTMLACQVATMLNYDFYDEETVDYVLSCCNNGVFYAEKWCGDFIEEDNRFVCAALISLVLLDVNRRKNMGELDSSTDLTTKFIISDDFFSLLLKKGFEKEKTIRYLLKCYNMDGGFGCIPGAESHCGQIYACLVSLKLLNALHRIDKTRMTFFLINRQEPSGGLNGRPYKKEDVCYSFWTLCSLDILNGVKYIDSNKLREYIEKCQSADGGYADRPGNVSDCFHTMYALLGLCLLDNNCGCKDVFHLGISLS
ncbi:Protein geranylgeranyltransferase type II, beta subunit [Trachipleistophora hominis]|uniref:Geranylgeranyl transferase type-2 subunit beta n=1 Tax=Trachipleistophora hominis TaxID=72359 RepID=L7JX00_TRAHO|nr:Protein geranylgeranyltransferase type II, beta subunit [Trachipleistophora hominis]